MSDTQRQKYKDERERERKKKRGGERKSEKERGNLGDITISIAKPSLCLNSYSSNVCFWKRVYNQCPDSELAHQKDMQFSDKEQKWQSQFTYILIYTSYKNIERALKVSMNKRLIKTLQH